MAIHTLAYGRGGSRGAPRSCRGTGRRGGAAAYSVIVHVPRSVGAEGWERSLSRSLRRGATTRKPPFPPHPPCFPYCQPWFLTPRPPEPASGKLARGRKRKYVISCAARRSTGCGGRGGGGGGGVEENTCVESMAILLPARVDGFSTPPHASCRTPDASTPDATPDKAKYPLP